jgi:S-adenosylmethionine decarboxylase proenzyme
MQNNIYKMFSENKISGKHMIIDLKEIKNNELIHDLDKIKTLLDGICEKYDFSILNKSEHVFHPEGLTILYLLSESHLSVHTFPERKYIAIDLYTCREYVDDTVYNEIYNFLVESFQAKKEIPTIIDRHF